MTEPTPRLDPAAASRVALAALLVAVVLGMARPAEAIKLWERKETRRSPSTPAEPTRPGSETRTTTPEIADSSTRSGLVGEAAAALPPLPGHVLADPFTFVRRQDHLSALLPLAAAAAASDASRDTRLRYAEGLAQRGYGPEAAEGYLAILAAQPDVIAAWIDLGSLLRVEGHHDLSARVLAHAIDLQPRHGLAWYQLALTRRANGDLPGADAAFLKALDADPRLWLPRDNPHVVVNDRAAIVLHDHYVKRTSEAGPLAGSASLSER